MFFRVEILYTPLLLILASLSFSEQCRNKSLFELGLAFSDHFQTSSISIYSGTLDDDSVESRECRDTFPDICLHDVRDKSRHAGCDNAGRLLCPRHHCRGIGCGNRFAVGVCLPVEEGLRTCHRTFAGNPSCCLNISVSFARQLDQPDFR